MIFNGITILLILSSTNSEKDKFVRELIYTYLAFVIFKAKPIVLELFEYSV
ncbi:hypothetical protein BN1088_1432476 [Sphingobacterium sp. PM2-P1-29]|nr:hypothetical protein BN1088_1432476 [Sphingobacterium sp. PM2-P1-29]